MSAPDVINSGAALPASPPDGPKKGISIEKLNELMALKAIHGHTGKEQEEIQKVRIQHTFTSKLNDILAIVKPRGDSALIITPELREKLDNIKNYPQQVEKDLAGSNMSDARKQEMIESAKTLAKRAEHIVASIEKDNLDAAARKDLKEDLDSLIKEISTDVNMHFNMFNQMAQTLSQIVAMANAISKTVHEMWKKAIRGISEK